MHRYIFCLLLAFTDVSGFSQVIEGTVLDSDTQQPLQGATVYLDGTTTMSITDADGSFRINRGVNENSTLVFTYVGYYNQTIDQLSKFTGKRLKVMMARNLTELDEVIIGKSRFSRKQMLACFRTEFLGTSRAARSCTILNESEIVLFFDEENGTLSATARSPLKIKNDYLGYELHFDLADFQVKFPLKTPDLYHSVSNSFSGTTFFSDISNNERILNRRLEIFQGSAPHLMHSIAHEITQQQGFEIYVGGFKTDPKIYFKTTDTIGIKKIRLLKEPVELVRKIDPVTGKFPDHKAQVSEKDLVLKKTVLNILYNRDKQSVMDFVEREVVVDQDGNYAPIYAVVFGGYIGSLKAGDMLPRDFYQTFKTKAKQ